MNYIKMLRLQRNLSQEALAIMLGVHPTFLSRLECGWVARVPPRIEARLRATLGSEWGFTELMRKVPTPSASETGQGDTCVERS